MLSISSQLQVHVHLYNIHFLVVCGKCIIYTESECYNLPQQPVISSLV